MGRAARWLRGLLGGGGRKSPDPDEPGEARSGKGKKKWGFGKSFREKEAPPRQGAGAVAGSYREVPGPPRPYARPAGSMDDEQNKRAIAVAAATAAVAEAAVAAAQAAAAVVRLTSSGRGAGGFGDAAAAFSGGYGKREKWAAVRIQSAFRGYLARRALKALKGLVKLQALVRGNIVRKQAAETLRCMQALVRVQARARASRALHSEHSGSEKSLSTHAGPPTPEKYEQAAQVGFVKPDLSSNIRRTSMKPIAVNNVELDRTNPAGWNWLDRWMEERYWDSRELTKRAAISASTDDERSAKILEVDPGKPQFNNKRRNNHHYSSCSTLTSDQNSRSFATIPDSPSKDSTVAQQSVPSPSSVDMHHSLNTLRFPVEVGDYVESPHVYSASSRHGSSRRGPFTPSKSECSRSFFSGYSDYPNYMANTESSRAKLRSQSAPKQRPDYEKLSSSIKRLTAHEYGQNPSGASAQKSSSLHAKFTNKAYPGSGRLDRLGMPIRY